MPHPQIALANQPFSWFGHPSLGALLNIETAPDSNWLQVCSRCIYDERVGGISFSRDGVCRYCDQVDELESLYGTGSRVGENLLARKFDQVRHDGRHQEFDCIIGVSGGTDSSYLVRMAKKEWGLRPLAVHYDNTWNTGTAARNISRVLTTYNTPLLTYVVNHEVADRIFRAFFLSGVPELEASTDLAYAYVLRKVAARFRVGHILEGHSFTSEGITPLNNNYFDGKYIKSVVANAEHAGFIGEEPHVPKEHEYPLMTLPRFMWNAVMRKVSFTRPLWYLDYDKESAKQLLSEESGWSDYGGHHLENRMTSFFHSIYLPRKFNTDYRNNALAAAARRGISGRDQAWKEYCGDPYVEEGLESYFVSRLGLTPEIFGKSMDEPGRNWTEFPTYKKKFEMLAPLFRYLAKRDRVTMSFYLKYCRR